MKVLSLQVRYKALNEDFVGKSPAEPRHSIKLPSQPGLALQGSPRMSRENRCFNVSKEYGTTLGTELTPKQLS